MSERRGFQVEAQGENEILGTREFDAPPEMVWKAWTEPELLRRWLLGPDGWVMQVCEVDARDMALKSPMDEGMAAGYNRLDEVLAVLAAEAGEQGAE